MIRQNNKAKQNETVELSLNFFVLVRKEMLKVILSISFYSGDFFVLIEYPKIVCSID